MTRGRRRTVKVLVVLASLLAFLSIFSIWVERQALDTDEWVKTSSELLERETIRVALSEYLVDQVYANIDVEEEVGGILPKDLRELAGPVSGGLRRVAGQGAEELLKTSTAEDLWQQANRAAHEQLVAVLEEEREGAISTEEGTVRLNLGELVADLAEQFGIGENLANQLPPDAGQVTILRSDDLETAQDITRAVKGLAILLTLLTLAALALAVYISRGERWVTILFAGIGLVAAAFAALVARQVAGNIVVDELVVDAGIEPAAKDAWSIATSLLVSISVTLIVFGLLVGAAGWLASPTPGAHRTRGVMAPILRGYVAYVYAGIAILFGLYFLLGPAQGLRSFLTTLVVAAFVAVGIHQLRRQSAEEFPDASLGDGFGRARERLAGAARSVGSEAGEQAARIRSRVGEGRSERSREAPSPSSSPSPSADDEDARLARLERLGDLHQKGILSDEEFAAEKARLFGRD